MQVVKAVSRDLNERTLKKLNITFHITQPQYESLENHDSSILAVAQSLKLAKCQNEK